MNRTTLTQKDLLREARSIARLYKSKMRRMSGRGDFWPIWRPVPRRPWVLQNRWGQRYAEGGRAKTFNTAQEAYAFGEKRGLLATPNRESA